MPSRLSIFSSRIFGSALIWTVLAVALIEWRAARTLPGRFFSHEVDQLLYDLNQGRIPADDTVFLGDSVGRQIANGILRQHPGAFVPLACNAAIEIPGQYYLLQRYLENHPAPRRLILMMGYPLAGELQGNFTENYVQRDFLRWREIAGLTRARRSPRFGLVMTAYKLCPAFRFRLSLQKAVPFLETPDPYFGWFDLAAAPAAQEKPVAHGLLDLIARGLEKHRGGPGIAENYFQKLAMLMEERHIDWVYFPLPVPESAASLIAPDGDYDRQVRRVRKQSRCFPHLQVVEPFSVHPDGWFRDGAHLNDEQLPEVAKEYAARLAGLGFLEPAP